MMYRFLSIFLVALTFSAYAQDETDEFTTINTPVTIDLNAQDDIDVVAPKKKKRKKNVFYGIKTRRAFTQDGYGDKRTMELFYLIKDPISSDSYVRDIYWYDYRRNKIRVGGKIDLENGALLHGPYKKCYAQCKKDQVLEEGIFYMGTKHGRWVKLDKDDKLVDKEGYYKGWPKESQVRYYDQNGKKIKEIVPIEYGEKEGNYFYFFDNGLVAVTGEYHFGSKVGKWTEYHYNSQRRKKIIQYPEDPYDKTSQPFTWREYDKRGKIVYENKSGS